VAKQKTTIDYMENQNGKTQGQTNLKHDEIAARAYKIWETSGHEAGCDLKHWLQAEEELSAAKASQTSAKPDQRAAAQTAELLGTEASKAHSKRPGAPVRDRAQSAQSRAVAA
jgi:hypothetical protein